VPPAAHPGQAATPCRLECTLQAGAPRSSHHQAALHGPSSARRACIPMLRSMPGAGHAHLGQGLILLQRGVRPGQQPRDRAQPRVRARQRARRARVALDDGLRALRQVPHLRSGRGLSSVCRFQGIVMKTTHCLRAPPMANGHPTCAATALCRARIHSTGVRTTQRWHAHWWQAGLQSGRSLCSVYDFQLFEMRGHAHRKRPYLPPAERACFLLVHGAQVHAACMHVGMVQAGRVTASSPPLERRAVHGSHARALSCSHQ